MHTHDPAAFNTQNQQTGSCVQVPTWRPWGESSEYKQCRPLGWAGELGGWVVWGKTLHFTSLSQHFDFLRLELPAMNIPFEKN